MTQSTIRPGDPLSLLSRDRRNRDRDALSSGMSVDLLVVGGGVTGVGVALDAATRGLSVALVEAHDYAFGTSRWSSKMVHGGLRYLAKGDVGVAWESATERAVIGKTVAPYLVHPFAQLIPIFDTTDSRAASPPGGECTQGTCCGELVGSPHPLFPVLPGSALMKHASLFRRFHQRVSLVPTLAGTISSKMTPDWLLQSLVQPPPTAQPC